MRYIDRLQVVRPGTLVATSRGIAVYVSSGCLSGRLKVSRAVERYQRRGWEFVELSDEEPDWSEK